VQGQPRRQVKERTTCRVCVSRVLSVSTVSTACTLDETPDGACLCLLTFVFPPLVRCAATPSRPARRAMHSAASRFVKIILTTKVVILS
jgi:hypothetical protein